MSTCKQWAIPEGFFQGLCNKTYDPVQGTNECGVCVTPTLGTPLACNDLRFLASSVGETINIPANLFVNFQAGEMTFRQPYVCNRTATIGTAGTSLIPELVGKTVSFPTVLVDSSKRVWETAWIPCGTRFSSHKKLRAETGETLRYYRQDWNVEVRLRMELPITARPYPNPPCFPQITFEARRTNNITSGTVWWSFPSNGQAPGYESCLGWRIAGYLWGIPNNTIENLNTKYGFLLDYKRDFPENPNQPCDTYLAQLCTDVNKAKPKFNWRLASIGCAAHNVSIVNSVEEEVVCSLNGSIETCTSYSGKVFPRFTQGMADVSTCGVPTTYPPWSPGIIVARLFQ